MKMKKLLSLALAAVVFAGTALPVAAAPVAAPVTAPAPAPAAAAVREQDDFYNAINHKWLAETKIPQGQATWGNFEEINKSVEDKLNGIMADFSKDTKLPANSDEKKLVNLYNTALDLKSRDKDGIRPIKPYFDRIARVKTLAEFNKMSTDFIKDGYYGLFTYGIGADAKDSNMNVLYLATANLGLQNRDDYLSAHPRAVAIQTAYKNYLKTLFTLKGDTAKVAEQKMNAVFNLEKTLATSLFTMEEGMDPSKSYNVVTPAELKKMAPAVDMAAMMKDLGLTPAKKLIATQPKYFAALNGQYTVKNMQTLKAYMESVVLRTSAGHLTSAFSKAGFEYSKVFTGVNEMRPIEQRAFGLVNGSLGDVLGKAYVTKYFPQAAKDELKAMTQEVIAQYGERIKALEWMTPATKTAALKKLKTMVVKIGYPDKWENYNDLTIKTYKEGGSLSANMINLARRGVQKELKLLNKPVDKTAWGMTPQTINAYYNPSANEIVFPAAILQGAFYTYGASKAQNLGGIGVVIGHEISHAFDDNGSMFDENGNMVNWWTPEDFKQYQALTAKLVDQFNKYELMPGAFVNGSMTLGENIADLGGVNVALDILKKDKAPDYKTFFTAYAALWRNLYTPQVAMAMLQQDPHTPGIFRVNGVLTNLDAFYEVYGVTEKDKLYKKPADRIKIW